MDTENWLNIPGYDGYQVSDQGNVRSFWKKGGNPPAKIYLPRMLKTSQHSIESGGHYYVNLAYYDNTGIRKHKTMGVHQAVLLTFVGPCPEGMEVRHFPDRETANNRLENLSYATHKENMADKKVHGTERIGSRSVGAKLNEDTVLEIRQRYALGGITQIQLAEEYGVGHTAIGELLLGHHWQHIDMVESAIQPLDDSVWDGLDDPTEMSRQGVEVWLDLPYQGYQVSNTGNVRSRWSKGVHPRLMGPRWWNMKIVATRNKHGEIISTIVRICPVTSSPFTVRIATLVVTAFLGPTPDGKRVTQLSGEHTDNRLCNLAFRTTNEIMQSAGKRGALLRHRKTILTKEQVSEIRQRVGEGEIQRRLAEEYGVHFALISAIVHRKAWKHI